MTSIEKQPMGIYKANCYVLKKDGYALIIDPGLYPEKVEEMLGDATPLAILITHCHCDHVCAVDPLAEKYNIPIYMHEADRQMLRMKRRTPSAYKNFFQRPSLMYTIPKMEIGPFTLNIWETPGHTDGSVTIQWEKHLFTGDMLFVDTVGDFDPWEEGVMQDSLSQFLSMEPDWIVHPGHKEDGVLKDIIENNRQFRAIVYGKI